MQAINVCPKSGRPMRSRRCFSCGYVIPKEEILETKENETGDQKEIKENVQGISAPSSMPHESINSTERNASKLSTLKELSKRTVHRSQPDHPEQQAATVSVPKNTAAVLTEVKRDPDEKPGLPKVTVPPKVNTVQQNYVSAPSASKKPVEPEKKDDDAIDTEALKKLIAGQSRFVKPKITKGLSGKPVTLNKTVPPILKVAEDPVPKTLNRENEERLPENPPANKEESMSPVPENTAAPDMAKNNISKEPDRSTRETIPEEAVDPSGDASGQGMNADEKKIYESYFVSKKLTNVKDPVKKEPEKKDSLLSGFMKKGRKKDEEQPEEADEEEENIPDSIFNPNADHYYDDTIPDVISEPDRIKKSDIMKVVGSIFVVLLIIVMLILYI